MLFSKKNKEVKFENMAHDQAPDIKELEASLDFLKNKPAENESEHKEAVKESQNEASNDTSNEASNQTSNETSIKATIEADKDAPNEAPIEAPIKAPTEAPIEVNTEAANDAHTDSHIEAPDEISNDISNEASNVVSDAAPAESSAGEIREENKEDHKDNNIGGQGVHPTPENSTGRLSDSTAEESDGSYHEHENVAHDTGEVSDAVKEAQALMAQYEAKKASGELKIDERRKYARSRFYHMSASELSNQAIIDISELEKNNEKASGNPDEKDQTSQTDSPQTAPSQIDRSRIDASVTDNGSTVTEEATGEKAEENSEVKPEENSEVMPKEKSEEKSEDKLADDPEETNKSSLLTEIRTPENKDDNASDKVRKMDFRNNALLQSDRDISGDEDNAGAKADKKDAQDDAASEDAEKPGKKGPFTGETKIVKVPPRDIISEVEAKINTLSKLAPLSQLKNPLPHPKKHISRKMDFDLLPNMEQMCFDVEDMTDKDFFDIE
ncbi:MAG: hypothetical protein K6C99_03275 [Lachnospiraceae bacterium]|nr:hypothetical protein [Lachnospiraceae bacterium]